MMAMMAMMAMMGVIMRVRRATNVIGGPVAINDWGHQWMRPALRAAQKAISQMNHFWTQEVRSNKIFAKGQDLKWLATNDQLEAVLGLLTH